MHSTQLIRDPLAVTTLLWLMLVLSLLLNREFAWGGALGLGVGGAALVTSHGAVTYLNGEPRRIRLSA